MITATSSRNVRRFSGGEYVAALMAEIERAAITARVQAKRDESGLTQQEVADLMNVTVRTVQYWESQKRPIVQMDRLDELARTIGTTKFWLLHGADLPGSAEDAATLAEIVRRLGALEDQVEQQGQVTAKSVDALARAVRSLERRSTGADGRASRAAG